MSYQRDEQAATIIKRHNNNNNNNKLYHGWNRKNTLVKTMSIVGCAILTILLFAQLTHSIIIPPKFYIPFHHYHHNGLHSTNGYNKVAGDENTPYVLTINEGSSLSEPLNYRSAITVNLNRAVQQDVGVLLTVYSGPNLISFDPVQQHDQKLSSTSNTTTTTTLTTKNVKSLEISSTCRINYPANTFGDRIVYFNTHDVAGHAEIVATIINQPKGITIDDKTAYISINIYRNWNLDVVIQIVGWIYFFAWSISFYFQFILNYQRKSVVGLNFDFLALNLLGFTCYTIFNATLLFSDKVQHEYYKRYTYSRIPVEYNDLFFAVHAAVITIFTVVQCFIYERGIQQVSIPSMIFVSLSSTVGIGLFIASLFNAVSILDVVLYLSYVKLVITIIKYVPQAYMNYQRKATTGWSIHNIILDFTGGSLSFLQMLLIATNYNDWISIFGNFAKFGLGIISMSFDIIFLLQHYVLYRDGQQLVSSNDFENSSESVPSPVISHSIRSANATQHHQQTAEDSDEITEREE